MQDGSIEGCPNCIDARAKLIASAVGLELVIANAVVERQILDDLPFVLNITASRPCVFGAVVNYRLRRV